MRRKIKNIKAEQDKIAKDVNDLIKKICILYTKYTHKELDMSIFRLYSSQIGKVKDVKNYWLSNIASNDSVELIEEICEVARRYYSLGNDYFYIDKETNYIDSKEQITIYYVDEELYEEYTLPEFIEENYFYSLKEFIESKLSLYKLASFDEMDAKIISVYATKIQVIQKLGIYSEDLYVDFKEEIILNKEQMKTEIINLIKNEKGKSTFIWASNEQFINFLNEIAHL
ncbi:hypothetical protein VO56_02180 [Mycoplasmopsis gallinacea]|uniref:Uncharacterized protein n=1 Tax=Mycoplasmopsis gallinacea TaxID=29556 RepID=A0A0D5ZJU2_9BACT|nr:hypothetical protein VO56_02180 [Mycoplasmopsis gallinacea]